MGYRGVADPGKLLPVELDFLAADELIEIERRLDRTDGEAVRLGDSINVIGRDHGGDARHVLHDDIRRAGNIFGDELGDHASVEVIHASGRGAGNKSDSFALIERSLGLDVIKPKGGRIEKANTVGSIKWPLSLLDGELPALYLAKTILLLDSLPSCHSPSSLRMRATTSAGVTITSFANDSISSHFVGSISSRRLSASARNAASTIVLSNASRKILIRSAGTPGGATIGRPKSPDARITFASVRPVALVLYLSINS